MRFHSFTIENYRAITGPLTINLAKMSLLPIIGVNESGKTTILHAIFAFDYHNDRLNSGRHLQDTANLYRTQSPPPTVTARVDITAQDFADVLDGIDPQADDALAKGIRSYRRKRNTLPGMIDIRRNLATKRYQLVIPGFNNRSLNDAVARAIINQLPYLLFFDDFRDSVGERIEIEHQDADNPSGWLAVMQQLFRKTDPGYSVFDLHALEERRRKSVLARVKRYLNSTLTKEWQNFRLDERDALEISLEFEQSVDETQQRREYLRLEVIERDANEDEHYFFISDRSKGFFWFFNFVMKLEFNPKVLEGVEETVYLLDEPGSYLHAFAQTKLCGKLRQLSTTNRVIYCTHSHYLLDPEIIPLSNIKVADKDRSGDITLQSIHEHQGSMLERRSAFQPVLDALQVKPYVLDLSYHDLVVITEGICDYYCFEMFKEGRRLGVLPSVGADSIAYYVSLMIAWRVQFVALWDNDTIGRRECGRALDKFGNEIGERSFHLLPTENNRKRILQDLFTSRDLRFIRERLGIPLNTSFEKTVATLFYCADRSEIVREISRETKDNFRSVFRVIAAE